MIKNVNLKEAKKFIRVLQNGWVFRLQLSILWFLLFESNMREIKSESYNKLILCSKSVLPNMRAT